MNNYERIKSLSIDGMAEFIQCDDCYYCKASNICNCWGNGESYENCTKYAKQWLLEECE